VSCLFTFSKTHLEILRFFSLVTLFCIHFIPNKYFGLEEREGEYMTEFSFFCVNYLFKAYAKFYKTK